MIDGKTMTFRTRLSAAACAVLLVGACSPAPGASTTAPKESASEAFSRRGPEVAATAPAAPAVATAEAVTPADGPPAATTAAAKPAPGQVAAAAVPVVPPAVTRTSTQTPPPPAAVVRTGGLPAGPGRETVERVCSSCHAIGLVTAKGRTEDGWAEVIGRMIGHGLEASDDDLQTVHAYLSRELPPK